MWSKLQRLAEDYPNLMTIGVLGKSRLGREIPIVILTQSKTGLEKNKSALFVDANIHAGEIAGNATAMYWIEQLLLGYTDHVDVKELLDRHTVYVVPRIAVDGAEEYLTSPHWLRSSPHRYPESTYVPHGWIPSDVNQDGRIVSLRVPAADGGWVIDTEDPRLMRAREPGEIGGTFYHVFPEGHIDHQPQTGEMPPFYHVDRVTRQGMDFNRNFPVRWAGESGQPGAGPFPLSEPELHHLARFIADHPNIAGYVALHTSGGVILRQPSLGDDTTLNEIDRELFTRVAAMGEQVSGYFARSNYQTFATGHEEVLMPGAADDWMYEHQGVLSFTVEIWDLPREAGVLGYAEKGMKALREHTPQDTLQSWKNIYRFLDDHAPEAIVPWQVFSHPDLGVVEIGGLDIKYSVQNPPASLLERECQKVSRFLTRLGHTLPQLTMGAVRMERLGTDRYRIVAEVVNQGYLPTSSTQHGQELGVESVVATIAGDFHMIAGRTPFLLKHLSGYGARTMPRQQREYAEWIIEARAGTQVTIGFSAPRSGQVSQVVYIARKGGE